MCKSLFLWHHYDIKEQDFFSPARDLNVKRKKIRWCFMVIVMSHDAWGTFPQCRTRFVLGSTSILEMSPGLLIYKVCKFQYRKLHRLHTMCCIKKLIQISKIHQSTNYHGLWEPTTLMEIASNSSQHSSSLLFWPTPRYKQKEPRNISKLPSASLGELAPVLAWGKPQNSTKLLINIINCACID